MPSIEITLRKDYRGEWSLYAPKGHRIAGPFRGSVYGAQEWARQWASTWPEWVVSLEIEENHGLSGQALLQKE